MTITRTRYLAIYRKDGRLTAHAPEPDTLDECLTCLCEPGIEPEAVYDSGSGFLLWGRALDEWLTDHAAALVAEAQHEHGLAQRRLGL